MSLRSIWSGTVTFGLVSVPVNLVKAQDRQGISFRQLHEGCGERVKMPKVCPVHGEITMDDIVRGYETEAGALIEVPEGEFDTTRPDASRVIDVKGFVNTSDIDPIARDRTYFLTPAKEKGGREGYALLVEAMARTRRAALGTFVLWGRENLCTVRSDGAILYLDLLYYSEDIRPTAPVDDMISDVQVEDEMVDLAVQLIQGQALEFDHSTYFSEYREKLRELLEGLAKGKQPKKAKPAPAPKKDEDLLAALKASVNANKTPEKKPATRRRKTVAAGRKK